MVVGGREMRGMFAFGVQRVAWPVFNRVACSRLAITRVSSSHHHVRLLALSAAALSHHTVLPTSHGNIPG